MYRQATNSVAKICPLCHYASLVTVRCWLEVHGLESPAVVKWSKEERFGSETTFIENDGNIICPSCKSCIKSEELIQKLR